MWEWNLGTGEVNWDGAMTSLLGIQGEPKPMGEAVAGTVHPDDLESVRSKLQAAAVPGGLFAGEFRIVRRPGCNVRWLAVHAQTTDGRPLRMYGVGYDITDRVQAERAFREGEKRLRLFIEHTPAALAVFGRDIRYLAVSHRWLRDYRLERPSLTGRSHYDVFADFSSRWRDAHVQALAGEVVRADEDQFDRADGSTQWLRWELIPWREETGDIGGLVMFTEDITHLKRAEGR